MAPRVGLARRGRTVSAGVALLAATLLAAPAAAQTGFTPDGAERQRAIEAAVVERIQPDALSTTSWTLTERPHVAGSPAQADAPGSAPARSPTRRRSSPSPRRAGG